MAHDFINLKGLTKRIGELQTELTQLLHLQGLVGGSTSKGKRGRPAGSKPAAAKPAKAGKKGKRGKLGEGILKFLSTKGKEGAHITAIAEHVGTKPNNVTAWAYTTGKPKIKKVAPATFALK